MRLRALFKSGSRNLMAVIVSMAIVNLVYGIAFPLFALVMDAQGASKTLIGLSTLVQAVAVFAIAPFAPGLIDRIRPARLMQWVSLALAVLFLMCGLLSNMIAWFPLRFFIGSLTALMWITSEALINELADERSRGKVIGLYSSVGAAGFALGPLLLALTGSEGLLPFACTAAMIFLAAVPLLAVSSTGALAPGDEGEAAGHGLWKIFLAAPVIMLANVAYGAMAESMITFFPIFGISVGLSQAHTLGLLAIMGVGSMVCVLPLGWLADHVNRLGLLAACVSITMAGLMVMPVVLKYPIFSGAFMFAFGGIEGMIYALAVILMGQYFKGMSLAKASTAFTACWGAGTVIGPLMTGLGMDHLGEEWMVAILCLFLALYLPFPFTAWRRSRRSEIAGFG